MLERKQMQNACYIVLRVWKYKGAHEEEKGKKDKDWKRNKNKRK